MPKATNFTLVTGERKGKKVQYYEGFFYSQIQLGVQTFVEILLANVVVRVLIVKCNKVSDLFKYEFMGR